MSGEEEPSRVVGGCVLVVLAGGVAAVMFAIDEAAGVLGVVAVGWVALWRCTRRIGTDLPLPSPTGLPSPHDEKAGQTAVVHREGMSIYLTPDADNPVRTHVYVELTADE